MKRVVTIQDLSGIGKCSLAAALPILSAMGAECAVLPTALLSAHTAFPGYRFFDLTDRMSAMASHWRELGIRFDGVYTGYLGSAEQIPFVSSLVREYRSQGALAVVDPAMADGGELYAGLSPGFAQSLMDLCLCADVILPNLTEASFLLGLPYRGEDRSEADLRDLLLRLADRGIARPVLTGVSLRPDRIGVLAYDAGSGAFFRYENERLPLSCPGTGDVFASAFTGAALRGLSTEDSLALAVDFSLEALRKTAEDPDRVWYGTNFEAAIPGLIRMLEDRSAGAEAKKEPAR